MAGGGIYDIAPTAVGSSSAINFQPTGTQEVIINNIYTGGVSCELYKTNGTTPILSDTAAGWLGYRFRARSTNYIQLKNTSTNSINVSCDGVITTT